LRLPGQTVARLDPFRGSVKNGKFGIETFHIRLPVEAIAPTAKATPRPRSLTTPENSVEAALTEDSVAHQGVLRLNLHLSDVAPLFKLTSAFGHPLNKGWEYGGNATGALAWNWGSTLKQARQSGFLELTKARLQVAGLNEPLKIEDARLEWKDGIRSASLTKVDAFGAAWSGTVSENTDGTANEDGNWHFQLHADDVDATELDHWVGPRSRPNWLQRLMAPLLGTTNKAQASELLRRVSAEGELTADLLTVEKIKLAKVHALLTLHALHLDVRNAEAQWAGGAVHGGMQARFSMPPKYDMTADIVGVNLAQLPWSPRWGERWSGLASGKIHLSTNGVGREDLLKQLAGGGELKLNKIEFRGWDIEESAQSGGPSTGASRWTSGEGEFQLSDQQVHLDGFRLDAPHQRTQLVGTISFGMDGNLVFTPKPRALPGAHPTAQARQLRVSGQLEDPAVAVSPVQTDQARP
jgi:hypothetical protein